MTDRGVSEVIGFVLVFSIVTATIGIVYATGFPGLQDASEAEHLENMGRAFDVLADNLKDIHQQDTPSRATEVKIAGGTISMGDAAKLTVDVVNTSNSSRNDSYGMTANPILYEKDDTKLVYSMGGVFRQQERGTTMLSAPGWINDSERTVIPFINTYGRNDFSLGGETTILLVAERKSNRLRGPFKVDNGAKARVNVTIESPRSDAWKRFFEDRGYEALDDDPSDDTVKYQFNTTEIYLPQTGIEVSLNR